MINAFLDDFWIIPDLRCQKRLFFLCFSSTSTIWRSGPFFTFPPLHFSEPLRKWKAMICDLWLVDFNPFCVFLCIKVRCFVFEKHLKFYLSSKFFLTFLYWNVASLNFKPEIVPIQLPNPEETQKWKGENELIRSR